MEDRRKKDCGSGSGEKNRECGDGGGGGGGVGRSGGKEGGGGGGGGEKKEHLPTGIVEVSELLGSLCPTAFTAKTVN